MPLPQMLRSQNWQVQWRPTRPPRINTKKKKKIHPFHQRGLECKNRKSRDTWNNRQVSPLSTKWNRAKANRVCQESALVIANTLFQQHTGQLYTWTSPNGQYRNQTDYICSWRWKQLAKQLAKKDQDQTVAQIISSLLKNWGWNQRK